MAYRLIITGCGCGVLASFFGPVDYPYITEDSSIDRSDEDYKPFETEDEHFFYIPENIHSMADPKRISQEDAAPDLTTMSAFLGIQLIVDDNGDPILDGDGNQTYRNYTFTPAQMVEYAGAKRPASFTITLSGDASEYTDPFTDEFPAGRLAGRDVTTLVYDGGIDNKIFTKDIVSNTILFGSTISAGTIITFNLA